MSNADTLKAAGWTHDPTTGKWCSPLTGHEFPERAALAIVAIRPRARQPLYRPRHVTRR